MSFALKTRGSLSLLHAETIVAHEKHAGAQTEELIRNYPGGALKMPKSNHLPPPTILVIEDHPDQRELLEVFLERDGYRVVTAASGVEALEKLEAEPAQIILSDIRMPRMDGFEFCRRIRSDPKFSSTYLIFLTAKILEQDRVRGLDLGADDYIVKPFSSSELLARVRIAARVVHYQQHLQNQSLTDSLTGILSRATFEDKVQEEFERAKRYERPLSLLLLDIDDFKAVNSSYGYHCGDGALKKIADYLRCKTRRCDFPARYDGGKFALVLPETNLARALHVGKKVGSEIKGSIFGTAVKPFSLTVSIGVSSTSEKQYFDWRQMLQDTNRALDAAKNRGKDRVESLFPDGNAKSIASYP